MKLYWIRLREMPAAVVIVIALSIPVSVVLVACARATAADDTETAFVAENNAAMSRMMTAMAIQPSGDVDRDFVASMVPHHEGAIEMAEAELRHGRNEHLRRIAQEIIVDQTQEIAAMRLALGQPASGSPPPASDSLPPASDSLPPASDSLPPASDSPPPASDSAPGTRK
jgi:Domain of unknown function (DUF305)